MSNVSKQDLLKRLAAEPEDTDKIVAISPVELNTKREALACAARALRQHQREVWAQYSWSSQVQEVCDEYYEVIHGIEMQIVELDRQEKVSKDG